MCWASALNWRENAKEKLRKCAEKVIKNDEKAVKKWQIPVKSVKKWCDFRVVLMKKDEK
jgi:hypothetical protein